MKKMGLTLALFATLGLAVPDANAVVRCHYNSRGQRVCVKTRSKKKQVAIIGGSAAGGALIGGLTGGPKGAIIGGGVGAAGGAIYNAKTKKKVIR